MQPRPVYIRWDPEESGADALSGVVVRLWCLFCARADGTRALACVIGNLSAPTRTGIAAGDAAARRQITQDLAGDKSGEARN